MSWPRNQSYQGPVTMPGHRRYVQGESWLCFREVDMYAAKRPIYLDHPTALPGPFVPALNPASGPPFSPRREPELLLRSSFQGQGISTNGESNMRGAGHHNWQWAPELESPCPLHQMVLKPCEERQICDEAGSCQRFHLSSSGLCKWVVQKARRALQKVGRKPGSKNCRPLSIPLAPSCDPIDFRTSLLNANGEFDNLFETAPYELSGDDTIPELPAESVAAEKAAVYEFPGDSFVRLPPQQPSVKHCTDLALPQHPFAWYSGSGSSFSMSSRSLWQGSSSTRYTSNTELLDFGSPPRRLSELEGSFSGSSFSSPRPVINQNCILPSAGPNMPVKSAPTPASVSDSHNRAVDLPPAPEVVSWPEQLSRNLFMGEMDICVSPTSLPPAGGFSDPQIDENRVYELGSKDCDTYQATAPNVVATASLSKDVTMSEHACETVFDLSIRTANDLDRCNDGHISMPVCPFRGLPMRPDTDLSDLVAGATSCGLSSHILVHDNRATLVQGIQDMFTLLLDLADQQLDQFEPEVKMVLAPAFKVVPTLHTGWKALYELHAGQPLRHIDQLVSFVFMAFSIAILAIDERDLLQFTGAMYGEMKVWGDALSSATDKDAFGTFLDTLWSPQGPDPVTSVGPCEVYPFPIPKPLPMRDWRSVPLSNNMAMRPRVTVDLCQYYVGLILHAAENEVSSRAYSPDHVPIKEPPPIFLDSAMEFMQFFLDQQTCDEMREVDSSTMEALRHGKLSSFHQLDVYRKREVHNRRKHFGDFSRSISQIFSNTCQSEAVTFARRQVTWLMSTFQNCASRVVSQTGLEGVNSPEMDMQRQHEWTTHSPAAFATDVQSKRPLDLNQPVRSPKKTCSRLTLAKSTADRKPGQQRKVPQDTHPLSCPECTSVFQKKYRRDALRRHLSSVHGNRYYKCPVCLRQLKYRTDLNAKHLRKCRQKHGM